ncbi:MAG: Transcriptional regulator protein [Burkholderiaceae bacterium]|jgi:DNA-binding LytR/AlgR family response regulator|nr:MAG: Transcriptional regulator protein [Burkholderiaceae bacterium]
MTRPTALIAEDEPLLAAALQAELARAWPELALVAVVGDGPSAVARTLGLAPDLLFFDVRMPGMSGLDAAAELADAWPPEHAADKPFPALVFVTAYDQYAVQAFEAQAIDYLLKPVQPARLEKTVAKLKQALAASSQAAANPQAPLEQAVEHLRALLAAGAGPSAQQAAPLRMIQAGVGNTIQMVPVDEVVCFEAADKYVRVLTAEHEYLVRTPLKDLLPRLDRDAFWQVHRGTVVRASAIASVRRDDAGRLSLALRGRGEKIAVSRLYANLFKAM